MSTLIDKDDAINALVEMAAYDTPEDIRHAVRNINRDECWIGGVIDCIDILEDMEGVEENNGQL